MASIWRSWATTTRFQVIGPVWGLSGAALVAILMPWISGDCAQISRQQTVRTAGQDGNKHVGLNLDRIKYWLSVGAQPSNTVSRLLGQAGVIPRPASGLHKGAVKNPDKPRSKQT